jgi:hypothetical protein
MKTDRPTANTKKDNTQMQTVIFMKKDRSKNRKRGKEMLKNNRKGLSNMIPTGPEGAVLGRGRMGG